MIKSDAYRQFCYWLEEMAADNPKGQVRDALLMGVLTDAWNDSKIQFSEYVMLFLNTWPCSMTLMQLKPLTANL